MRVRASLVKHFSWWINKLLFLSLCLEGSTSRVVAKLLTGVTAGIADQKQGTHEDNTFQSDIHKMTINLTRFLKFLESECDEEERQKTWQAAHVLTHHSATHLIAQGEHDIWNLEWMLPIVLVTYREHYKFNYAAFPSNSHMAESAMKDANFCQMPGRGEQLSSTFFTARAGWLKQST
jgi:hypothetical protein